MPQPGMPPLLSFNFTCVQVGALVGGITARQRKVELERLNEQLRRINLSLRQQARAGTLYAPGGCSGGRLHWSLGTADMHTGFGYTRGN
jgi:hypothetical protein